MFFIRCRLHLTADTSPAEERVRSGGISSILAACIRSTRCKPHSLISSRTRQTARRRTRSCASACTADFCTATCPTYQLLGDELDGPRGRIYLIKQVLEGHEVTAKTQLHLDRCLTCRNCETTCPSGVKYGRLVDIGRKVVDDHVPRPAGDRLTRIALKEGVTSPLFGPAMRVGQMVRPACCRSRCKTRCQPRQASGRWPAGSHPRKVLLLEGCVQPSMAPNINTATARVLDALGIETLRPAAAGCCGAIRYHLNDHDGGLADARRNIEAWWPYVATRRGRWTCSR